MAIQGYLQSRLQTQGYDLWYLLMACALMAMLLLQSACASTSGGVSKDRQSQLGSIGVQVQPFNPEVRIRRDRLNPVKEVGQITSDTIRGVGTGAVAGPLLGTVGAVYISHGLLPEGCGKMIPAGKIGVPKATGPGCRIAWLGLFVLVEPIGLAVGTAAGIGTGITSGVREAHSRRGGRFGEAVQVEQKVIQEMRSLNIEATVQRYLVQTVRRAHADRVVPLQDEIPSFPVSTRLTTRILGFRIDGDATQYRLHMSVEVNLVRQHDGTTLYARTLDHAGKAKRYDEHPLEIEVPYFCKDLAKEIATAMFR